jgi:hypothetical protein
VDRSRCRVAAHERSLHAGFAVVHHKTVGLLVGGRRWDPGAPRSFEAKDTHRGRKACVKAKRCVVARHRSDGATMRIPKVPLGGVYPSIM